eukprot:Skav235416  [mRNA]  locus=scaffold924:114031:118563:- [translate_table: standard]
MAATCGKYEVVLQKQLSATTFAGAISMFGGSEVIVHVQSAVAHHVSKCSSITVIDPVVRTIEATVHIHVDDAKGLILLHPSATRGPYRIAELFGGLGGWSHASTHSNAHPVAIVDFDAKVCHACAKTFNNTVMDVDAFYEYALSIDSASVGPKPIVVQCSVHCNKLWAALSFLNVSVILASPPCQPWSTTGRQGGLATFEGLIFPTTLDYAAEAKVHAVLAENVAGFPNHADFHDVIAKAAVKGLRLVDGCLVGCQRVLPVLRNRWLGIFLHVSIPLDPELVKQVKGHCIQTIACQAPAVGPCLQEADAVHVNISSTECELLTPSVEAVTMFKRYDLAPRWLLDKVDSKLSEPVLAARIVPPTGKMSGVMARYGTQHLLPLDLLQEKGLHTMLHGCLEDFRYFSPWEVLASLGFPPSQFISVGIHDAFQQTGNALSPVHAGFTIAKAHELLGPLSPFTVQGGVHDIVASILDSAIKLSQFSARVDGDLCCLTKISKPIADEPSNKRMKVDRIEPTAPFQVDPQLGGTVMLEFEPDFHMPSNEGLCLSTGNANGGVILLRHKQKHWMMLVHGACEEALASVVQRALPHAKPDHFLRFLDGHQTLTWDQKIHCVPAKSVTFEPVEMAFTCAMDHGITLSMNGDVTWTVCTMKAYIAASLRCNSDALHVLAKDVPTHDGDFLAEYETCSFQGKFKACMPRYFSFAPRESTMDMKDFAPKPPDCVRFVAKHPLKKLTRSVVAHATADIGSVIRMLFPDMCEQASWQVSCGGQPVGPCMPIADLHSFTIDWHCFRPLVPTTVDKVMLHSSVDSAALQVQHSLCPQRWVKSPFSSRASIIRMQESLDIKQIIGSYFVHTQMAINVTCHLGGHILDPDTTLRDVPIDQVICFKVAPLLGGAKATIEQLRARVKSVLLAHGVLADAGADRANAFLNKAEHETLLKHMGDDDSNFWLAIKDEANRVHFRLVYRNELQQAKKEGRSKPSGKHPGKPKVTPKPRDDFVASASNIKIDIDHFRDGDKCVQLLDASRFGMDQSGLAIMTKEDADKHDCSQTISMDALAILIVGKSFADTDEPFTMPAYNNQGQPIIIRAALRQFGDRPVQFRAAVPMMEVGATASTTLELHIRRDEVVSWKECGVPLHYLGVHISAVRGSSLISAWALRSFSADRKPVPYRDAAYWHGYIKVDDTILDQVLQRSGWAGIYVTPRTPDKRLDERFTAITVPDTSLGDLQKKTSGLERALGIVRIKDHLAIRCRREHATAIRSVVLPESAFVTTHQFDQQDSLWLLKNIPCEIGHQGLLQALEKAGWDASPIRAQGQNRWIVAAKTAPPAMHFCINQTYVLVEPAKRSNDQGSVTMVAKQFKVDTVTTSCNGTTQVATTSRFQEIKTEMSEQMELRLHDANQKIEQLQQALTQVQQNQQAQVIANQNAQQELAQLREELAFARQKISEVEGSVVASGQTVIQTMQTMMQNMQQTLQQNLESSMKQIIATESTTEKEKRARTGGTPPKHDPFANKA